MATKVEQKRAGRLKVFDADESQFRRCFGNAAFLLEHRLVDNPLFSPAGLEKAAQSWMKLNRTDRFVVVGGQDRTDVKLSAMIEKQPIAGAIELLRESNSYIKISDVGAVNAAYADLLRDALGDVGALLGLTIHNQVTWSQMTVFLTSPNVATPYHIDHEANFLCQIAGEKEVCLFDPNDRELLTDREIESFYLGNLDGAEFCERWKDRGRIFRLKPGLAVHHPPLAPHWVKNGPGVSISVSINFCMRDIDRRARIYQVNGMLRRIGLAPTPPGRWAITDTLKAGGLGALSVATPKSYREAVFSGLDRVRAPYRIVKKLVRRKSAG